MCKQLEELCPPNVINQLFVLEPVEEMPFMRFGLQMMPRILPTICKWLISCILYIFKYEMFIRAERREPEEQDDQEGK